MRLNTNLVGCIYMDTEFVELHCTRGHVWRSWRGNTDPSCPNVVFGGFECPGESYIVGPRCDAEHSRGAEELLCTPV